MNFNKTEALKLGARDFNQSDLASVELTDLIGHVSADTMVLIPLTNGGKILHVKNSKTNQGYSIGFGKSVDNVPEDMDDLREVINECTIFTGWNDRQGVKRERPWFSFGKAGIFGDDVVTISIADLLAQPSNVA